MILRRCLAFFYLLSVVTLATTVSEYRSNCVENDAHSCYELALIVDKNSRSKKELLDVAELYAKSCMLGCSNLGYMFDNGIAVKKDKKYALYLYELSCEHNVTIGCRNSGVAYHQAKPQKRDYKKAYYYMVWGC